MKLIHLSDLHLGKRVNEFSMMEDQKYILKQILQRIDEEQPDGVILAGDIYDKPVPPAEAVELFDEFLVDLSRRGLQTYQRQARFGRAAGIRRAAHGRQRDTFCTGI